MSAGGNCASEACERFGVGLHLREVTQHGAASEVLGLVLDGKRQETRNTV